MISFREHQPIIWLVLFLLAGCEDVQARPEFSKTTATVFTQSGAHTLHLEIAQTPDQQRYGLMYVKELPTNTGMIFVHNTPQTISMWMKNTYITLDMIFLDDSGRITHIHKYAKPHDETAISAFAQYVIELPAGNVDTIDAAIGDYVRVLGIIQ